MTTDTQLAPTDAEIEALGHQLCWRYKHDAGVSHVSTWKFNAQTLHDFARAVHARWGAPVGAEPVARLEIGKTKGGVSLTHIAEPAAFQLREGMYALYTAPQPTPAPLSDEVVKDAARYRFLRDGEWRDTDLEPFIRLQLNTLWDTKIDAARAA